MGLRAAGRIGGASRADHGCTMAKKMPRGSSRRFRGSRPVWVRWSARAAMTSVITMRASIRSTWKRCSRPILLIVLGGPIGVYEGGLIRSSPMKSPRVAARIDADRPMLGICLGAQMMAAALGARVAPGPVKEIGWAPLTLTAAGRASVLAPLGAVAGAALARRQLRIARGLRAARFDAALSGAGIHAHAVAARLAVSSGDRAGSVRKLAGRPHRRTRQSRHRSARAAHPGTHPRCSDARTRTESAVHMAR